MHLARRPPPRRRPAPAWSGPRCRPGAGDPAVVAGQGAVPGPQHLAGRWSARPASPGCTRGPGPAGSSDSRADAGSTAPASCSTARSSPSVPLQHAGAAGDPDPVPRRQEPCQRLLLDRLDLGPQRGQRPAPEQPQHLGVDELRRPVVTRRSARAERPELPLGQPPGSGQPTQRIGDHRDPETEPGRRLGRNERSVGPRVPAQQPAERVVDRLQQRLGDARRQRGAQSIAQHRRRRSGRPTAPRRRSAPRWRAGSPRARPGRRRRRPPSCADRPRWSSAGRES